MAFNNPKKTGPISEINVTPLVDVMLVLLVIFMVTAPMMFSGVELDLPKTKKAQSVQLTQEQVILSITKQGEFYIGQQKFLKEDLVRGILGLFDRYKTDLLYIRADYELTYGNVARLMAELKDSGIQKISLVTEIAKESSD